MEYIICDIDGTIANCEHRVHLLSSGSKNKWDLFYDACDKDKPIDSIINLIRDLCFDCEKQLIFLTGRRNSVRQKTQEWINHHVFLDLNEPPTTLLMRRDGDFRHDTDVKPELLSGWQIMKDVRGDAINFILEDRNSMVKKWRELGFTCLQVAEGDF